MDGGDVPPPLTGRLKRGAGRQAARIGYARVSTEDQDCAAQIHELTAAGCSEIVTEHASGADQRRPALARLLDSLKPGDTLIVVRLDRLARSTRHLLQIVDAVQLAGAALRSLRDPVDTSTPAGSFTLTILAAVAELERGLIVERTKAGIEAARRAGRQPGNPGLCAGDPAAAADLAAARNKAYLRRATAELGPWLDTIQAHRPAPWPIVATRLAAAGGPAWNGERLRRTIGRLDRAGLLMRDS